MAKKKILKQKTIIEPSISKIEILEEGMRSAFWELILQAMKESKDFIEEQQAGQDIADLPAEQYKLMNELFKAKKMMIDKLMETPRNMIDWMSRPDYTEKNFDPYDEGSE